MWWKSRFLSRFCFKWTHDVKSKYFCNEYRAVLALITSTRWLNPDLCPPPRNINSKSLLQVTGKDSGRKAKWPCKVNNENHRRIHNCITYQRWSFFWKTINCWNHYCIESILHMFNYNSFQLGVALHIETSCLISSAKYVTGFYMKCSNGLKWVKNKDKF